MSEDQIKTSVDARGVATIRLNRPEKHNVLTKYMVARLKELLARYAEDAQVRVLVLTGAGRSFCAGGDLSWVKGAMDEDREGRIALSRELGALFKAIRSFPKPVIGQINGTAMGGGTGLVTTCDVAVGLAGAKFAMSETRIGLIPGHVGMYMIDRIGVARARSVMLSGASFHGHRAVQIGFLDEICEDETALQVRIDQIVEDHLAASPAAIAALKQLLDHVGEHGTANSFAFAEERIADIWDNPDARERIGKFLSPKPSERTST